MRKEALIMPISLLVAALFIGTAMVPVAIATESQQQSSELQVVGAVETIGSNGDGGILCDKAVEIIISAVMQAFKNFITSITKGDIKEILLHALQYLPILVEKVKNAFFTGLEMAKNALEALLGVAIDIAGLAQIIWDVIDEFVINIVIPSALKTLDTAYNVIVKGYGSILNFLIELAKPLFKLIPFLVWLAEALALVLAPYALWLIKNAIIPGLKWGAKTLKDAICAYLGGICNPSGGETMGTGSTQTGGTLTAPTSTGTTTSSSSSCSLCQAAASASSASSATASS